MLALLIALVIIPGADGPAGGPWRELIRFEPTAERRDGVSLWLTDSAVLPADASARRDVRAAQELWVVHGATVGGQAFTIISKRYDCDRGDIFTDAVSTYARDGRLLATVGARSEPDYPQTHSAEFEAYRAVCMSSQRAARGDRVASTLEAVQRVTGQSDPAAAGAMQMDLDYDGLPDTVSLAMRPHSLRHDLEIVLGARANRTLNIVVAQQPSRGPIVQRALRPVERDRYVTACRVVDGRDVDPCRTDYPLVQRGVEIVADGQPSYLVWLEAGEPQVVRLP